MTRVIFKHENQDNDGTPVGPVTITTDDAPESDTIGEPYRKECVCDGPHASEIHPNGGPCLTCGEWWRPYYRLPDAEALAALHGVDLEEQ